MRNHRFGIGLFAALACLAAIGGVLWYAFFGHAAEREPEGTLVDITVPESETAGTSLDVAWHDWAADGVPA